MTNYPSAFQDISKTIERYFRGTYEGNAQQLRTVFHKEARITGNINSQSYDWSLSEFIHRVTAEPTAATKSELYDKQILSMDIAGETAMVKARVVINHLIFTDYIILLKINHQWVIRNKSFSTD